MQFIILEQHYLSLFYSCLPCTSQKVETNQCSGCEKIKIKSKVQFQELSVCDNLKAQFLREIKKSPEFLSPPQEFKTFAVILQPLCSQKSKMWSLTRKFQIKEVHFSIKKNFLTLQNTLSEFDVNRWFTC